MGTTPVEHLWKPLEVRRKDVVVGDSFTHLHVHTEYSMLDGAARVGDVVAAAAADGQPALGITDHGNMYGILPFYKECKEHGIKPILGCLLAGQEIITDLGVKPVEEIEVGDRVLTHRGRFRRVVRTMRRPYEGRGYEVVLAGRHGRTLTLTEEHPILVRSSDGRTEWTKPGEIEPGRHHNSSVSFATRNWKSWVCLPKLSKGERALDLADLLPPHFEFASGHAEQAAKRYLTASLRSWPEVPRYLSLTSQLGRLLGLFAAEGSTTHVNDLLTGVFTFSLHLEEQHLAEEIATAFAAFGVTVDIRPRPDKTLLEVVGCCLPLAHLFTRLCGSGAAAKFVSGEILNGPEDFREAFLSGVLDGDGKNPVVRSNAAGRRDLMVASRSLAWGVRTLLADLGHWVTVTHGFDRIRPGGLVELPHEHFIVTYAPNRAYSPTIEDVDYVYRPILEVNEVVVLDEVFNFEVEEDNSYVSDFVLHNCEAYMAHDSRLERPSRRGRVDDTGGDAGGGQKLYYHLTLLAESYAGYRNLIQLSSRAFMEGYYYKPRLDWELLEQHSEGVIATTGCLGGQVLQYLLRGDEEAALKAAGRLQDIFGRDNLFVEIQDHGIPEQHRTNPQLFDIAKRIGAPLLATNDSHYTHRHDAVAHDALLCVQTGSLMSDPDRLKFHGDDHYLKSAREMRQLFSEVEVACDNSLWIAERCNVEIEFGKPLLPDFPLPEGFTDDGDYLRHLTLEGARKRWGEQIPDAAVERLAFELEVIGNMGFSSYSLITWDLIKHARDSNIRVGPGRGSAAGCAVAYCLWITDLDPIKYDLLFERFLNPSRVSMPDIDMDFDSRYRDEMIRYAAERYGRDHVAQIVTFSTIKARAAVRDAARVLGYPYAVGDKVAKAMPPLIMGRDTPLHACLEPNDKFADGYKMASDLRHMYAEDPDIKKVIDVARGLEGMRRQDGIHAAAVVITKDPLTEYLPIQRKPLAGQDIENAPVVTQYEMAGVEELGLLKMDFLGLRNLDVISDTLELVKGFHNVDLDIDNVPLDDEKTLALLCRGDSIGVFQLEGGPMRALMRSLAPDCFEDVAALVALYRPGPMSVNMHYDYADRKNGRKPVEYFHPDAEELLGDTYGLMIYQESVMRVSQRFAGYSLAEADNLRKACGKKKPELMAKERDKFVEGCTATGFADLGTKLFDNIEGFANYAFNKSHSFGYGLVSYQTAYLKAHYPVEYLAALLTSVKTSLEKAAVYLNECRTMGIQVLVPDVNRSDIDFVAARLTDGTEVIPFGLSAVRNVGEALVTRIVEERTASGPFADFYDFCERVDMTVLNKKTLESLIKAGGFDSVGHPRRGLLAVFEQIVDNTIARRKERDMGVMTLFGAMEEQSGGGFDERAKIPDLHFDKKEQLAFEKEMLGLYVSDHPLMGAETALRRKTDNTIVELADLDDGVMRTIGGVVNGLQRKWTKKGDLMAVFTLEDLQASIEVMVFPKTMSDIGHQLADDAVLIVKGRVDKRDDQPKFIAMDVEVFEGITDGAPPLRLKVSPHRLDAGTVDELKVLLTRFPGESQVFLHLGEDKILRLPEQFCVDTSHGLIGEMRVLLGSAAIL